MANKPLHAGASQHKNGTVLWFDKSGLPACFATTKPFEGRKCCICDNYVIVFHVVDNDYICSACSPVLNHDATA